MISRSVILGFSLSLVVAVGLFQLKYKVSEQERHLTRVSQEIYKTEEAIHILQAEWSFLNEPGRLQMLAEKHLKLTSSEPIQLISYQQIQELCVSHKRTGFASITPAKY